MWNASPTSKQILRWVWIRSSGCARLADHVIKGCILSQPTPNSAITTSWIHTKINPVGWWCGSGKIAYSTDQPQNRSLENEGDLESMVYGSPSKSQPRGENHMS